MKFTAEDFKSTLTPYVKMPAGTYSFNDEYLREMVSFANRKLDEWRKSWVRVYKHAQPGMQSSNWFENIPQAFHPMTHQAYLVEIEPLEKKECAHEPRIDVLISKDYQQRTITDLCKHCGAKLKASWSVAE